MGKHGLIFSILALLVLGQATGIYAQPAEWQDIGGGNVHFTAVWVNPDNRFMILAGSGGAVLKTENNGKVWRRVLSVKGGSRCINSIMAAVSSRFLFAATNDGLYISHNQGDNWKRVFRGKDYSENECTSVAAIGERVYLGTKAGLFLSRDNCRSWHKEGGELADSHISTISWDAGNVYTASTQGVFRMGSDRDEWQKVFSCHNKGEEGLPEEAVEENTGEADSETADIPWLVSHPRKPGQLYLATSRGVYQSVDHGVTWDTLPDYGLFESAKLLSISPGDLLFAVTKKGIFVYRDERWHEVSIGLITREVSGVDLDTKGNIYAACDNGLFRAYVNYSKEASNGKTDNLYFSKDPAIREIQNAAIKYAEVDPEKIIRWRKQAAKKAFLPKFSASINRDTGDLWHWESGSSTKAYDDVLMRGRDTIGWDVTLSWDLSEIIWSSDQTSIDTRSRLLVQLRGDILDEVTKLYFERIRVKTELDNLAIEDRRKRLEKELRLRELTAMLDGLTGGYFSR